MCQWRLSVKEDDNVTKQKIAYSGEAIRVMYLLMSVSNLWRNNPVSKKRKIKTRWWSYLGEVSVSM